MCCKTANKNCLIVFPTSKITPASEKERKSFHTRKCVNKPKGLSFRWTLPIFMTPFPGHTASAGRLLFENVFPISHLLTVLFHVHIALMLVATSLFTKLFLFSFRAALHILLSVSVEIMGWDELLLLTVPYLSAIHLINIKICSIFAVLFCVLSLRESPSLAQKIVMKWGSSPLEWLMLLATILMEVLTASNTTAQGKTQQNVKGNTNIAYTFVSTKGFYSHESCRRCQG